MSPPDPQQLEGARAPDRVPGGRALIVVAAMGVLTIVTGVALYAESPRGGESAVTTSPRLELPPADPFSFETAHEVRLDDQRARRERWEWTDRSHGRARRPLADAIDAYLAERAR